MKLENLVELIKLGKNCIDSNGQDNTFYNHTEDVVKYLEILLSSEVYNPVNIK